MKNFPILLVITVSLFCALSSAENLEMDDNGTVPTQRNVPEHIPGSNMIGAGRGRRVQDWKDKKATEAKNIPQQPPNRPQQHDATIPAVDQKK